MWVTFEKVVLRGVRRWKDESGKRRQETRNFWQTISQFNTGSNGLPKSRAQILEELRAERTAWLAEKGGK